MVWSKVKCSLLPDFIYLTSEFGIDPLQYVGMQLNLEGKTIGSNSQEIKIPLFCRPN